MYVYIYLCKQYDLTRILCVVCLNVFIARALKKNITGFDRVFHVYICSSSADVLYACYIIFHVSPHPRCMMKNDDVDDAGYITQF